MVNYNHKIEVIIDLYNLYNKIDQIVSIRIKWIIKNKLIMCYKIITQMIGLNKIIYSKAERTIIIT